MRPRGRRRTTWAAACAVLAVSLGVAAPAVADIGYVPSPDSGATVTHLDLIARHGTIGATVSVGARDRIIGVVIDLPSAGGTWQPAAKVTLASGLVCAGNTEGDSRAIYTCLTPLEPDDIELHQNLPPGRYVVALPITRPTGTVRGLTGTVSLTRPDAYSPSYDSTIVDTFPVLAPTVDKQSSAEVRNLDLGSTGIGTLFVGDLSVHVIVKPGESVTGVYVALPASAGGTAFAAQDVLGRQGIQCGEDLAHAPLPDTFVISCVEAYPHGAVWPAGSYPLTVRVAAIAGVAQGPSPGRVDLTFSGATRSTVDTFDATTDPFHRAPRT